MQPINHTFHIDGWLIDPRLNRMTGRDRTVLIEPKVMQVLACLAARPGEVLGRDDLLNQVWGDTIVTDHVLTRSISELRKVFADDPRQPSIIETIPKTGYRLIAPVQVAAPTHRYPGDSAPPRAGEISITATLPAAALPARKPQRTHRWMMAFGGLVTLALATSVWLLILSSSSTVKPLPSKPLTSLPGIEAFPVFHGQHLAFTWSGEDRTRSSLYVTLIDDETRLQLTDNATGIAAPAWSPDGSQIAFRRYGSDRCGIYLISALGGPERKLTDCHTGQYGLAWSPGGQWLAVSTQDSTTGAYGLSLIDVETRQHRALTLPEHPYHIDFNAKFSPDGQWLAFIRGLTPSMGDVFVIPVDGHALPKRLTFDNRHIPGLAWAADGQSLVFSSNRAGNYKLWRIPASGGEPVWLAAIGAHDPGGVAVAAESGYLAYEEWDYEINVWGVSLAASDAAKPARRFVVSTRWDYHPQISPDGRRIAFASNRSGSFEIWICDFDGTNPMRLTSFGGPFVGMPRWAPDGDLIAFDARTDDGYAAVYTIDADGGPPTRRTDAATNNLAPSWSRDGQWIYFASDRSGAWQVWKMPAAGGEAVQVTHDGGYLAFESMDGRALYISKYGSTGLWRLPPDGGAEAKVFDGPPLHHWGNWTVGADGIYVVERTADGPMLNVLDPTTKTVTRRRSLGTIPLSHEPGLTLSPDGQWLLFARADRVESDLMLVEQFRF